MGIDAKMFVKTKNTLSEKEILEMACQLSESFYPDNFWIDKEDENGHHCLKIIDSYYQDGPDIFPEPGEIFIEVYPSTRYYGEGYERGNLPLLIMIAEWLERKIPDCEVWYGGDSSGVCAELFDKSARDELFEHFVNNGHQPYVGFFSTVLGADTKYNSFCSFCKRSMSQVGFGKNWSKFRCTSCGEEKEIKEE